MTEEIKNINWNQVGPLLARIPLYMTFSLWMTDERKYGFRVTHVISKTKLEVCEFASTPTAAIEAVLKELEGENYEGNRLA